MKGSERVIFPHHHKNNNKIKEINIDDDRLLVWWKTCVLDVLNVVMISVEAVGRVSDG